MDIQGYKNATAELNAFSEWVKGHTERPDPKISINYTVAFEGFIKAVIGLKTAIEQLVRVSYRSKQSLINGGIVQRPLYQQGPLHSIEVDGSEYLLKRR